MTNIDDLQKIPTPQRTGRPADGAYGERKQLEDLKASLPEPAPAQSPVEPTQPGALSDQPVSNVRSNREASGIPGIPAPLLRPTDRPNEPVNTPPMPPGTAQVNPAQRRLAVLDILANSAEVSEETREWAQLWVRALSR